MDITQETITLLRLRLESIRRQVGPVRRYRAGRNCQKGYNCGGSCITRRKNCRKALGGEAKNFSEWMVQKMTAGIGGALGEKPVEKAVGRGNENPSHFDSGRYASTRDQLINDLAQKHGMNKWKSATNDVLGDIERTFISDASSRMDGDPTIINEGNTVIDSSGKVWQRSNPPGQWLHNGDIADREGNVFKKEGQTETKVSAKESPANTRLRGDKISGKFNPAAETTKTTKTTTKKQRQQLTANQIADFQPGVDQVVRKGNQTYVVSGSGLYQDKLVKSDALDDEGRSNLANMSPDRLARSAAAIAQTPYLSAEGKKERIEFIRELMKSQGDPMFG